MRSQLTVKDEIERLNTSLSLSKNNVVFLRSARCNDVFSLGKAGWHCYHDSSSATYDPATGGKLHTHSLLSQNHYNFCHHAAVRL